MHLRLTLLAFLTVALGMAISCRAGGNGLEKALAQLSEKDLQIMVLPAEELGDAYAGLSVSSDSGFQDNEEAADESFDGDDAAQDFDELGRITGYDLGYDDPDFLSLDWSGGLVGVVTSVSLFEDAEGASAFLQKEKSDAEEAEGDIEEGVLLQDVETRDIDLADEAMAMELHLSFGELHLYGTAVYLRLDRLVGLGALSRGDDEDTADEVERIAGLLHERIRDVLLGEVSATPVPLPEDTRRGDQQEDEPDLDAAPPEGVPDLSAMALGLDDLALGTTVLREGYDSDTGEAIAKFAREFALPSVPTGGSLSLGFENDIELYQDASQAGLNVALFEALVAEDGGSDLFNSLFQDAIEGEAGLETADITVTPLKVTAGDSAAGFRASFDSAFGTFQVTFVAVQVDRVVATLTFMSMDDDEGTSEVIALSTTLANKIRAALDDHS